MRLSDVVKQIRAVLPQYTDYFGDIQPIDNILATGGIATVTTSSPHALVNGQAATIVSVETRTPIESFSQIGNNFTFQCAIDHDLTFGWPDHANIRLGGFTDSAWNASFALKASDNRRVFKIQTPNSTPVLTGNEYLLEIRNDGINGVYPVSVVDPSTFTISGGFSDGTYTPVQGKVFSSPRVALTVDIERALKEYTEQNANNFWIFVEPIDVNVSKDRNAFSDATATIGQGVEMRTRMIDGFSVYIVAPTSNQIAAEEALDICRHDLLLPLMRTLYGAVFDTGLTVADGDFRTILNSHGVESYNRAFLVYKYEFQTVMDLTSGDTIRPSDTRAFRNIDYTQEIGGINTDNMTVSALDLDIVPF